MQVAGVEDRPDIAQTVSGDRRDFRFGASSYREAGAAVPRRSWKASPVIPAATHALRHNERRLLGVHSLPPISLIIGRKSVRA